MRKSAALLLTLMVCAALLCGCGADYTGAYKTALGLFADAKYDEAAAAFARLNDYRESAVYAAYSQGLVYYEQGRYADAEPYFEQAQGFMYGTQRYRYCHAYALLRQGEARAAGEAFRALGDFEDAPARASYCEALDAEAQKDYATALIRYEDAGAIEDAADRLDNLRVQIYAKANEYKDAGQYEPAMTLFAMLGDYRYAQELAQECKQVYNQQRYDEADRLEAEGALSEAYDAFRALTGFIDADARANEIGEILGVSEDD